MLEYAYFYSNLAQAIFLSPGVNSVPLTRIDSRLRSGLSARSACLRSDWPDFLPTDRPTRIAVYSSHPKITIFTSYRPLWRPITPRAKLV